jgi:hypothetical protein
LQPRRSLVALSVTHQRMRGSVFVGCLLALTFAASSSARANVARSETDGDRFGALLGGRDAAILVVDSEQLRFDIAPGLARARVTATYHFRNPTAHAHLTHACFVYVAGDAPSGDAPSITVDGTPVDVRTVRDVDEFRPRLEGWASTPLRGLVFPIAAEPGATRTVVATYTHVAGEDRAKHAAPTYRFDYLLSPAKSWKSFGPLTIDIALPEREAWSHASIPWRAVEHGYRIELAGLPNEELVFELLPRTQLWLGMTGHGGYWLILLAAIAIVSVAIARAATRLRHAAVRALVAGGSTLAASLAIVTVFVAVAPPYGLGFGYDPWVGAFAAMVCAAVAAAIYAARKSSTGGKNRSSAST